MHSRKTSKSSTKDVAGGMETMKLTDDSAAAAISTTSSSNTTQAPSAAPTEKPAKQDKERKDQKVAAKAQKGPKPQQGGGGGQKKKQEGPELIGITVKKAEDLSEWYQQVILKGDMLEFTDIPGCYIYQPASYRIWEFIQDFFNERELRLGCRGDVKPESSFWALVG